MPGVRKWPMTGLGAIHGPGEATDLAVDTGFPATGSALALTWPGRAFNCATRPRGRSSVGLERRPVTPKVAGSSPVAPAIQFADLHLCLIWSASAVPTRRPVGFQLFVGSLFSAQAAATLAASCHHATPQIVRSPAGCAARRTAADSRVCTMTRCDRGISMHTHIVDFDDHAPSRFAISHGNVTNHNTRL
jgi:hypothetical protein